MHDMMISMITNLVNELSVLLLGHDGVAEGEQPEELHRVPLASVDLNKRGK